MSLVVINQFMTCSAYSLSALSKFLFVVKFIATFCEYQWYCWVVCPFDAQMKLHLQLNKC